MVERPGPCDAGKPCTQRFHYVWNETGQLERASRWDLTLAPGESAGDAQILLRTPAWDLRYAYSDDGQRVLKSAQEGGQDARHTLEVFGPLRVENARFDGADYERTGQTEKVSLAGVGKRSKFSSSPFRTAKPERRVFTCAFRTPWARRAS